jgi:hypothetical protein
MWTSSTRGKSVRRPAFGAAALGLAVLCSSAALQADILKVIPEQSLAAAVTRNAEEAEKRIHDLVDKLVTDLPKESLIEPLLRELKLRPRKPKGDAAAADAGPASTIDLKGPFAMVLISPRDDAPGTPVAVVVRVRNYKDLLQELAGVVGAAAPEVTADGIDLLKGEKTSLFAIPSGDYAVVADAEYVIKAFKTDAEKNLAVADFPELRKAYETGDVAVYHNVDAVAKRYAADIDAWKQALGEQVKNPPKEEPVMMDPEKAARTFTAVAEWVVKSWSQTDAISWGFTFRDEGVRGAVRMRPVAETSFARLLARMKPGRPEILGFLGGPGVASAAWSIDPELFKDLIAPLDDILPKVDAADNKNGKKSFMECLRKLTDAGTGAGAYVWSPPGKEGGLLRYTYLIPLKPGADVSGAVKDFAESSTDLLNACGGPVRTRTKFEEGVETYRDCRIDRITDTFQQNPDAPVPLNPNANVLRMVEAVYGPELAIYVTRARDVLVYTIGYPATDAIKAQVDRVLDNKQGDLVQSADYQSALKGLPQECSVMTAFSLATLLRFGPSEPALMTGKDREEAIRRIKFDRPAGVGLTVAPVGKDVAVDFNVSIQEMRDIREFVLELRRQAAQKQQPPKPKEPAKPFGPAGQ